MTAYCDQTTCPICGGELEEHWNGCGLVCKDCGQQFAIDDDGSLFSETYYPEMNELDD